MGLDHQLGGLDKRLDRRVGLGQFLGKKLAQATKWEVYTERQKQVPLWEVSGVWADLADFLGDIVAFDTASPPSSRWGPLPYSETRDI